MLISCSIPPSKSRYGKFDLMEILDFTEHFNLTENFDFCQIILNWQKILIWRKSKFPWNQNFLWKKFFCQINIFGQIKIFAKSRQRRVGHDENIKRVEQVQLWSLGTKTFMKTIMTDRNTLVAQQASLFSKFSVWCKNFREQITYFSWKRVFDNYDIFDHLITLNFSWKSYSNVCSRWGSYWSF